MLLVSTESQSRSDGPPALMLQITVVTVEAAPGSTPTQKLLRFTREEVDEIHNAIHQYEDTYLALREAFGG